MTGPRGIRRPSEPTPPALRHRPAHRGTPRCTAPRFAVWKSAPPAATWLRRRMPRWATTRPKHHPPGSRSPGGPARWWREESPAGSRFRSPVCRRASPRQQPSRGWGRLRPPLPCPPRLRSLPRPPRDCRRRSRARHRGECPRSLGLSACWSISSRRSCVILSSKPGRATRRPHCPPPTLPRLQTPPIPPQASNHSPSG